MTVRTFKLSGALPIVGIDGVTRTAGTVKLDDDVTNIDALVQMGAFKGAVQDESQADDAPATDDAAPPETGTKKD